MLNKPTLSRAQQSDPALDQKQLYDLGLEHVRRLSRRLWTDHNLHDPGITTLELLCYALTDLAYRAGFPVADLLAGGAGKAAGMTDQFFTAREILPNAPLTERDYRKLLIDLPDVRNAWIKPAARRFYADTVKRELRHDDPGLPGIRPIDVKGLYRVRIEYMDTVRTEEDRAKVRAAVGRCLQAHRNLCEDFVAVEDVVSQPYSLCAEVELESGVDPVEAAARIRFEVDRHLAPPVRPHSLGEMLERRHPDGSPYTVAEIFAGPALDHGFIDDAELDASQLREEVNLSDIISVVMDIPGVRAVRDQVVNPLFREKDDDPWTAVEPADKWHLPVPAGRQPRLSRDHVRIVFYQRGVPVTADAGSVGKRLQALEDAERLGLETPAPEDLPIPPGRPRRVEDYRSFQLDFPALYGLSEHGLSSRASPERRAQALQLKAYLLFFDQLMANYFAQLGQVSRLFSRDFAADYREDAQAAQTRFARLVDSFPDFAKVYGDKMDDKELAGLLEDHAGALERRNRLLDHLLARFAEDFHHYANTMRAAFGDSAAAVALAKGDFLADCPRLGAERGLAYDHSLQAPEALWNSTNVSGLERRIARLLGIADSSRRNLGALSYDNYVELDKAPGDEYRFRIRHAVSGRILLSSSTHYFTREAARAEMEEAVRRAQLPEGYSRHKTVDGRYYFNIVAADGEVLARRIEYFPTREAMDAAIEEVLLHLREYYSGEGMYLIENLLLMPHEEKPPYEDPFMPICVDPACSDCADDDPYSYRLHIVLPAYAGRFRNPDFRRFAEETIRQETPAHILPKVCWVNEDDMAVLEKAYRDWIAIRAGAATADRPQKMLALIRALFRSKNVYPKRLLRDCGCDTNKPPFILGRTALGSADPDE